MEKKTGRLEAFSDGIFGVAITMLAIEIGIKEYSKKENGNLDYLLVYCLPCNFFQRWRR